MKLKEIKFSNFKRFTDLTITNIPESAKLVVMVGPNGCGKTSVFEGIYLWYKYKCFSIVGDQSFYEKMGSIQNKDSLWYNW